MSNLVPVARIKRMDSLEIWFFVKKTKNYIQGKCYILMDSKMNILVGEFIPFEGVHLKNGFKERILILCQEAGS